MSIFLKLAYIFFIGSLFGWVLELFFRRFVSKANKDRRWINPGFLAGPYLPLYGFGLCVLYLLAGLENVSWISDFRAGKLLLFVVMALCMTAIEYIAGLIFIKGMKVKLWDYSEKKFNFQGIICLQFSLAWALMGAAYYFFIHPHILDGLQWLAENLAFSFVIGLFFGVFIVDVFYSTQILTRIRKHAVESGVIVRYEELRMQIRDFQERQKAKYGFLFTFRSDVPLSDHVRKLIEKQRSKK